MSYESFLKEKIYPDLENGRPDWDMPHTESVVHHIKEIIKRSQHLKLDFAVLVIAAYAHDWGYAGLFDHGQPLSLENVKDAKVEHMNIGASKIEKLLTDVTFDFLTALQKQRIVHLVQVHDKTELLKDVDELVLMEADTLGGLDVTRVKPSFDSDSNAKYMQNVRKNRFPLFITDYGKAEFEKLYKLREDYYKALRGK